MFGSNQSIYGETTFANLTKLIYRQAALTFEHAKTQTITGIMTLKGTHDELLAYGGVYARLCQVGLATPED